MNGLQCTHHVITYKLQSYQQKVIIGGTHLLWCLVYVNFTSSNYRFYKLILSPSSCFNKSFALVCICQSIVFLAVQQLLPGQWLGFNLHFQHVILRQFVRPHLCLVGVHLQNAKGLVETGPWLIESPTQTGWILHQVSYSLDMVLNKSGQTPQNSTLFWWNSILFWWNSTLLQWNTILFWWNGTCFDEMVPCLDEMVPCLDERVPCFDETVLAWLQRTRETF